MKYIEEKIKELEKEVALLKAKNKLEQIKTSDCMYNSSINLLSEPDLETSFASSWDSSEIYKNPLDTVTVNLSSTTEDNLPHNLDCVDTPYYYPDYPNVIGSWDDCNWDTSKVPPYPGHEIKENLTDEYGFNMNYEEPINSWKFTSDFDKEDKRFLEYLNKIKTKNKTEQKIEKDFGKIISKFRILNHEWEMDGYGYIVNNGIDNIIVTTNHGKIIVVDKDYLNLKIKEYKESIQETERALFLIK